MDLMTRRRALLAKVETSENLFNDTVIQGSFNASGGYAGSAIRIRTSNGIILSTGDYIINNDELFDVVVYVYTTADSFISSESFVAWNNSPFTFHVYGDRLVRFGWRRKNNTNINPSNITGITLYKR